MRAAAIIGPGCSAQSLVPFKSLVAAEFRWSIGPPSSRGEADVILLFGGDGTIHRHLRQLVDLGLPVLIVPTGSGNDFARALGIRRVHDSLIAWRRFYQGERNLRVIDLGMIRTLENTKKENSIHYFCAVAGVGLDAVVARRANHMPRWLRRHGGYALSLASSFSSYAAVPVKILTWDAENNALDAAAWKIRSDRATTLAAFANSPTYGGGMKIAPMAKLDDGLIDVCVIRGLGPFKLACMFPTIYFGRHLRVREVDYFQTAHARVETKSPSDVYADGEFVCRTPVEITVKHRALRVVT